MKEKKRKLADVLNRIWKANLNMEHYWFFPKPHEVKVKEITVKNEKRM